MECIELGYSNNVVWLFIFAEFDKNWPRGISVTV